MGKNPKKALQIEDVRFRENTLFLNEMEKFILDESWVIKIKPTRVLCKKIFAEAQSLNNHLKRLGVPTDDMFLLGIEKLAESVKGGNPAEAFYSEPYISTWLLPPNTFFYGRRFLNKSGGRPQKPQPLFTALPGLILYAETLKIRNKWAVVGRWLRERVGINKDPEKLYDWWDRNLPKSWNAFQKLSPQKKRAIQASTFRFLEFAGRKNKPQFFEKAFKQNGQKKIGLFRKLVGEDKKYWKSVERNFPFIAENLGVGFSPKIPCFIIRKRS